MNVPGCTTQGLQPLLQQGFEKGSIAGRIETYQDLLGIPPTPRAELESLSIDVLERTAEDLRKQLGR